MVQSYCTLCDWSYAAKALALYRSLERHAGDFVLWLLPLDEQTLRSFERLALPGVRLVSLADLEPRSMLADLQAGRIHRWWCFTLASVLCDNLLSWSASTSIMYLDADTFLFSSPELVFGEIELCGASIAAVPHRFPPRYVHYVDRGYFNVSSVYFRNDDAGRGCAGRWAAQCIARCDESTVGDQLYLDDWGSIYGERFHAIVHRGYGVGPWHCHDPSLFLDGYQLVLFHAHELRVAVEGDRHNLFRIGDGAYEWIQEWVEMPVEIKVERIGDLVPTAENMKGLWRLTDYPLCAEAVGKVYYPYVAALEQDQGCLERIMA